jgi:hypothetical protein
MEVECCYRYPNFDTLHAIKVSMKQPLGKTAVALGGVVLAMLTLPVTALGTAGTPLASAALQS